MSTIYLKMAGAVAVASTLAACSGGGSVVFANKNLPPVVTKGSPNVSINQGGQALIVEQGKTPTTGVHGWVAIQSVASGTLNGSDGGTAVIMNRHQPVNGGRGLSSSH